MSQEKVERQRVHPVFPTLAETAANPSLNYSDHAPILFNVNLGESIPPLKCISLNIQGPMAESNVCRMASMGLENKEDPEQYSRLVQERYERTIEGLKKAADTQNAELILLQEARPKELIDILKNKLGDGWVIVTEEDAQIITCYKDNRIAIRGNSVSFDRSIGMLTSDFDIAGKHVRVGNNWGIYNDSPVFQENNFRNYFNQSEADVTVIAGDTNSRVAPLNDNPQNITTGVIPPIFNKSYKIGEVPVDFDTPIPEFADAAFTYEKGGPIRQAETQILDFSNGMIVEDQRTLEEIDAPLIPQMIMCLDETYKTKEAIGGKSVFDYEKILRQGFEDNSIVVRIASDYYNRRSIGIILEGTNPYSHIAVQNIIEHFKNEPTFSYRSREFSSEDVLQVSVENTMFISSDKVEELHVILDQVKNGVALFKQNAFNEKDLPNANEIALLFSATQGIKAFLGRPTTDPSEKNRADYYLNILSNPEVSPHFKAVTLFSLLASKDDELLKKDVLKALTIQDLSWGQKKVRRIINRYENRGENEPISKETESMSANIIDDANHANKDLPSNAKALALLSLATQGIKAYLERPRGVFDFNSHLGFFSRLFDNQRGKNRADYYLNTFHDPKIPLELKMTALLALLASKDGATLKEDVIKALNVTGLKLAQKEVREILNGYNNLDKDSLISEKTNGLIANIVQQANHAPENGRLIMEPDEPEKQSQQQP